MILTSIRRAARYHTAHAPARILNIADAPRDQVNVGVEDGLTGHPPTIDPDVEPLHILIQFAYRMAGSIKS